MLLLFLQYTSVYKALSLPFTVAYTLARGFGVTPMFVYWLYDTWQSESTATLRGGVWAKAYYTVCFGIMMLGSYIWMYKLLTGYAKYLAKKGKKAE